MSLPENLFLVYDTVKEVDQVLGARSLNNFRKLLWKVIRIKNIQLLGPLNA